MRKAIKPDVTFAVFLALASSVTGCANSEDWPTDIRPKTLDAPTALANTDTIVLAVPIEHRDLREWLRPSFAGPGAPRIAEVDTTLRVLRVFKGTLVPQEIHFLFYDSRGANLVVGMPKGPSGPIGSTGIFFLNRLPTGAYRSVVDVYRPDLSVSSMGLPVDSEPCASPADCIAESLLRYHDGEDEGEFASRLTINATVSERLAFLTALEILSEMAESEQVPKGIRRRICSIMGESYSLEMPVKCLLDLDDSRTRDEVTARGDRLREELRVGGLPWIRARIGTNDATRVELYVRRLVEKGNPETRSVGAYWLARLR